jgi:enoyl-CoA hydratase
VADYEQLLYDISDGVATVTLNRPEQRNALSGQMLGELVDALLRVREDEDARALVLTGAGDKVFCAGADLTFGTPEINVGAFPYMIMSIIYRNVPRKRVNEMILLGERMSAEEAVRYGLANKVVPAGEFDAAVAKWAGKLASKSPVLMRLGHDAMYRQQDMSIDDALEYLRSQLSLTFTTEDIQEGVRAFFEKREPEWKGR